MKQQEKLFPLQRQVVTAQSKILSKKPGDKERTAILAIEDKSGITIINVILRGIEITGNRDCIEEKIFKKIDNNKNPEREIGIARTPIKPNEKPFTIRPEEKRELLGAHFRVMKLEQVYLAENYNED